jgi:hypothetical protein
MATIPRQLILPDPATIHSVEDIKRHLLELNRAMQKNQLQLYNDLTAAQAVVIYKNGVECRFTVDSDKQVSIDKKVNGVWTETGFKFDVSS